MFDITFWKHAQCGAAWLVWLPGILLTLGAMMAAPPAMAQTPEWAGRLLPYTGKPDQLEHRFERAEARELNSNGHVVGVVTVALIYRGMDGRVASGQGRLYLPPALITGQIERAPLIYNAGYELDEAGAIRTVAKGRIVCTPHAEPVHPLVRGPNLDLALLHAARSLTWVDPLRVCIQGGSAGGWMTLLLTAESFPILWSSPDVPPIHWGYNAGYLQRNMKVAAPAAGSSAPRMPFLFPVSQIAEPSMQGLGTAYESTSALAVSPLGHLDTITAPTLALFSTADILVPIDQVSHALAKPRDAALMPSEYDTTISDRYAAVNGRRTLLDALPRGAYELLKFDVPADLPRIQVSQQNTGITPRTIILPFSRTHTWSIAVADEGAVEPGSAHMKFWWNADHEPFRQWAETRGVMAEQLTAKKLERLMKRILGEPWRLMETPGHGGEPAVQRELLDFPEAERADVIRGLRAFAENDARAERLGRLYSHLPKRLRLLGPSLGSGSAADVRRSLENPPPAVR